MDADELLYMLMIGLVWGVAGAVSLAQQGVKP